MRIDVTSPDDTRIALYRGVSDPALLAREGRFVAEGRLVVRRLLQASRFEVESALVTPAAWADMADVLGPAAARVPVFVAAREVLVQVSGFNIHRGCLAIGRRPAAADVAALLPSAGERAVVAVMEAVANADNVGGIFRSAQAFGVCAVLLDPATCDPLYRKAIRTSMGASLVVPFARVAEWPRGLETLRAANFAVVALTPDGGAIDIADIAGVRGAGLKVRAAAPAVPVEAQGGAAAVTLPLRLAVLVGNEGLGLSDEADAMADLRVRIPMVPGADSLNAATATGIALHALARYCGLV